jgi:hypothetical protein
MVVAVFARVLAQLILVLCFAAGMTASCIVFVLYGPVPTRRKVTIVSRLSPPDPFARRPAAALVAFPTQNHALPDVHVPPPPPVKAPEPLVAPLKLRRPRPGSPPPLRPRSAPPTPLPRSRSARGTERKPRPSELELELTQERTLDNTLESPRYSVDDMDTSAFATATYDERN